MTHVFVTNRGDRPHRDGWDGKKWEFAPGCTVQVPIEVARHVFGYGIDNKSDVIARLGWAATSKDLPAALARLAQFEITEDHSSKNVVQKNLDRVFVTNHGKTALEGMWDGKKWVFAPGKTVEVPHETATALFGHLRDDKEPSRELLKRFNPDIKNIGGVLQHFELTEDQPETAQAA